MLSQKFVLRESENFTSGPAIQAPPTIPINHYFSSRNQQNRKPAAVGPITDATQGHAAKGSHQRCRSPILLFHANLFATMKPALNTLIFSK